MIAWRDLPSLRDPDRFDSWVHRVLTNVCVERSSSCVVTSDTNRTEIVDRLTVLDVGGETVLIEHYGSSAQPDAIVGTMRFTATSP